LLRQFCLVSHQIDALVHRPWGARTPGKRWPVIWTLSLPETHRSWGHRFPRSLCCGGIQAKYATSDVLGLVLLLPPLQRLPLFTLSSPNDHLSSLRQSYADYSHLPYPTALDLSAWRQGPIHYSPSLSLSLSRQHQTFGFLTLQSNQYVVCDFRRLPRLRIRVITSP
jgi:hypothetical protein